MKLEKLLTFMAGMSLNKSLRDGQRGRKTTKVRCHRSPGKRAEAEGKCGQHQKWLEEQIK